ncbi:dipeptidase 1 (renal) [Boothiomyces sp. JEL0838]|nr:dipeptidase 1 (renal) [Boothiomyces sp. JEL0838]
MKGLPTHDAPAHKTKKCPFRWLPLLLIVSVFGFYHFQYLKSDDIPSDPLERARFLINHHPLIDTHNDLPWSIRNRKDDVLNVTVLPQSFHTDIVRMREGGLTGQIWSAYIGCEKDLTKKGDFILKTLQQIDIVKQLIKDNPDFAYAAEADDIISLFKQGKISSLIGIEGGHQIDDSLEALRMYYDLGVRYMTLTHGCHTNWADSASMPSLYNGLTDFGIKIVKEMNRIGMMVDISHVSHKTMRDVIKVTRAPLFASHSSSASLCPTERNMPDDVLLAMKDLDGVIMINFWPNLISCSSKATLSQVADHISYISNLVGPEHVGFGGDFDGIDVVTEGLEDVSKYPYLVAELIKRGFSDKDVVNIMGANLIRVLKKTELIAKEMTNVPTDRTRIEFPKTCQ